MTAPLDVIFVDDEEHLRMSAAQTFELAGMSACCFASAAEALEQISRDFAGVVVSDIRMPVMIHHGTHDESVPYWWSEEMWHLMEEAGVNVTFWPYPRGTHTLGGRGFETFMQRNLAFFDENVRGDVNSPD